jgi:hypothetical protein
MQSWPRVVRSTLQHTPISLYWRCRGCRVVSLLSIVSTARQKKLHRPTLTHLEATNHNFIEANDALSHHALLPLQEQHTSRKNPMAPRSRTPAQLMGIKPISCRPPQLLLLLVLLILCTTRSSAPPPPCPHRRGRKEIDQLYNDCLYYWDESCLSTLKDVGGGEKMREKWSVV